MAWESYNYRVSTNVSKIQNHASKYLAGIIFFYQRTLITTVINRPSKMGVRSAHRGAMIYALENIYDELINMDADFSNSKGTIPQILEN